MAGAIQTAAWWLRQFRDLVSDFGSLTDIAGRGFRDVVGILRDVHIASYLMQNRQQSIHLHMLAFLDDEQCSRVLAKVFQNTDADFPKSCTSGTFT
ncbi:hypothetical protein KL925_004763 [Ogataea polymorpha]|nr:hypothetical protein KL936_004710 [Ogataea polymorpha]KAG7891391.1 hypothetical protein KL908_004144 [Ogataea polymorpha]KAG7924921.1 hypothetical protein KL925_004763 [Ogataea polymorpha]